MAERLNIKDQIADNVDRSLEKHGHVGDDLSWDIGYGIVMDPTGPSVSTFFVIIMRSPILGAPPFTAPAMMDPRILRDPETADQIVMQVLAALRDTRSKVLATPNNGGN